MNQQNLYQFLGEEQKEMLINCIWDCLKKIPAPQQQQLCQKMPVSQKVPAPVPPSQKTFEKQSDEERDSGQRFLPKNNAKQKTPSKEKEEGEDEEEIHHDQLKNISVLRGRKFVVAKYYSDMHHVLFGKGTFDKKDILKQNGMQYGSYGILCQGWRYSAKKHEEMMEMFGENGIKPIEVEMKDLLYTKSNKAIELTKRNAAIQEEENEEGEKKSPPQSRVVPPSPVGGKSKTVIKKNKWGNHAEDTLGVVFTRCKTEGNKTGGTVAIGIQDEESQKRESIRSSPSLRKRLNCVSKKSGSMIPPKFVTRTSLSIYRLGNV